MNTPLSLEKRKQLVAAAAHDFVRNCRTHEHPLSPYADSIVALREKHASYRVIAEILHNAGVMVSHHSVARFCRDSLRMKSRKKGKVGKRAKARQSPRETSQQPTSAQNAKISQPASQTDVLKVIAQHREEKNETMSRQQRGPRIADPRNV